MRRIPSEGTFPATWSGRTLPRKLRLTMAISPARAEPESDGHSRRGASPDAVVPRRFGEQSPKQRPTTAETRHHGTDRNAERVRGLAVRKLLDVDQQDDGAVVLGNGLERPEHVLVAQFLGEGLLPDRRRLRGLVAEVDE